MSAVQPMTADDLSQVIALEQQAHPTPWSPALVQRSWQDHQAWVLREGSSVVAFAFVQRILDEAHLLDVVVDPAYRGRGWGRDLLTELITRSPDEGVTIWLLEVRASNQPAIALYQSLGFNEMGIRRGYYVDAQGREDALLMGYSVGQ